LELFVLFFEVEVAVVCAVLLFVADCDDAWVQAVSKVRVAAPVNKNFHLFDFMSFSSRSIDMLLV